jgi:hypothetical protein
MKMPGISSIYSNPLKASGHLRPGARWTHNEAMKRSAKRILTTHAGSLARPADLIAMRCEQEPPETCWRAFGGPLHAGHRITQCL